MIPDTFIQSLLERVDVADVVGRYVQLRKAGANLLGLCPFHNEKSPSFTVSPTKQFYHCFGCGAHGTAIRFVMEHTGANFPEAVRQLAESVGMVVPEEPRGPGGRAARAEQARRREEVSQHTLVLDSANAHYRRALRTSQIAIDYLKGRGLTGQVAAQYGLGWAAPDRHGLAAVFPDYDKPEFSALLVESGLVIQSDDGRRYDRFRERVMFPIRNARGHLVGFGGRVIGKGEPKYLNSPETPVFSKGTELYGLWEARQAIRTDGQAIVVEGYMDVVALAQMGVGNAVATLGTATTAQHVQKLLRVTDNIVFSFDGDKAGRRAAWRALQACLPLLRDDIAIRFLFLPGEHDPDSFIRAEGEGVFRQALKDAASLSRFMLDEWAAQHDLGQPEGRARCLHDAQPLMQAMPSGALRLQVVRELATLVRLTPDEIAPLLALEDKPSGPLINAGRRQPPGAAPATPGSGSARPASAAPSRAPQEGGPPLDDGPPPGFEDMGYVPDDGAYGGYGESSGPPPGMGGGHAGGQEGGWRGKSGYRQGGRNGKSERWQGKGKGRFRDRDWEDERDPPGSRRPVPALPQRLVRLLIAYPQLVEGVDSEAEAHLTAAKEFPLVLALIRIVRESGARHTGAVLQAAGEFEHDLNLAAADTLLVEELPDPEAELRDTLRSVAITRLQNELGELAKRAGDKEALVRFVECQREIARLRLVDRDAADS